MHVDANYLNTFKNKKILKFHVSLDIATLQRD